MPDSRQVPQPPEEQANPDHLPVVQGDNVAGDKVITQTAGGDIVGRDKIVNYIQNIAARALSAAEEANQAHELERQRLAQGVAALLWRLQGSLHDKHDTSAGNPYKGLLEYRLGDAEDFFGRGTAINELMSKLQRGRLTVLHSESGAGKTSLLQAGISPRLIAQGHLPIHVRPYDTEPSLPIKREFLADLGLTPLLERTTLRDFLRQVCATLGPQTLLFVFIDQFEEFWLESGPTKLEETTRTKFVRELAECLDDEGLNVRWVLSLRAEFFGHLANLRPLVRSPFENEYRLQRLDHTEAYTIVTQLALRHGVEFGSGIPERIVRDLGQESIAPSQLQLVCSALYTALQPGQQTITESDYEREGGAAGILGNYLERVLGRDLPVEQRAAARRLIESLVTSEAQRVIRTHSELVDELSARGLAPVTLDVILNQLVDSRLVRVGTDGPEGGEITYELVHDYLLTEVKLDSHTKQRKAAQELLEQELRAYRRHATLLSADRLAILEAARTELAFSPEAERLYAESRANLRQQQVRQRRLRALATIAVPLGLALVLTIAAFARYFSVSTNRSAGTATALAHVTALALAATQTVQAYTPTPMPTPVPLGEPGEIARVFNGELPLGVILDDQQPIRVPPNETRFVAVTIARYSAADPARASDGHLYLNRHTQLQFVLVTEDRFTFILLPGSDIFVQTEPFGSGVSIQFPDSLVEVIGRGCLSVQLIEPRALSIGCYDGECGYSMNRGESFTSLEVATWVHIDLGEAATFRSGTLTNTQYQHYRNLLSMTSAGLEDIDRCLVSGIDVTPQALLTRYRLLRFDQFQHREL
jgi:hypothetical protein